jgi:hypothetical protein
MHARMIVALSMWLVFAQPSMGADPPRATVYGAGNLSCGAWVQERKKSKNSNSDMMMSWTLGYLSAVELYTGQRHAKTDNAGVLAYLDKYCGENPLVPYGVAVAELSGSLALQKLTEK